MDRERTFRYGGIILAVMALVCLLIFGLSMMHERDRANKSLTGKEKALMTAQSRLSDTDAALDAALVENENYYWAQQENIRQLGDMESRLQDAQTQLQQLTREKDAAQEALSQVTGELDTVRAALESTSQERDDARTALAAMTQERDVALISLAAVADEKEQTQEKLKTATSGQNDAQTQADALAKEIEEIKTEMGAVTMERDNARAQVKKLTEENSELQQTIDTMNLGRDGLNQQLDHMTGEKEALDGQIKALTSEKDDLAGQLENMTGERNALNQQLEQAIGERDTLSAELDNVKCELDSLALQLGEMTWQRDQAESQLASVTEAFDAAVQEKNDAFAVPIGTWVMEPYTFRVPAFWMMQQDEAGNLHFYYEQGGCVLSCVHEKNERYLDADGIMQMYEERSQQMAASLQVAQNQMQQEWYTLSGGPCQVTRYQLQGMDMFQLQYCHDGMNTLVITYTDRMGKAALAADALAQLLQSIAYLPDAM